MTEPATKEATPKEATPKEVTPEEIAAAEEKRVNDLAVGKLSTEALSDAPLRMTEDKYVGIVGMARRVNAGETGVSVADVQRECDAVFGEGKVDANDIVTPPEPEAKAEATTTSKSTTK